MCIHLSHVVHVHVHYVRVYLFRNMELELLLAKMRSNTSDNVAYEASKNEVQRMMNDFTKKMQDKLDEHCSSEEQHFREKKRIEELQKRVCDACEIMNITLLMHPKSSSTRSRESYDDHFKC